MEGRVEGGRGGREGRRKGEEGKSGKRREAEEIGTEQMKEGQRGGEDEG